MPTRRRLLTTASVAVGSLAGCLGVLDGDGGGGSGGDADGDDERQGGTDGDATGSATVSFTRRSAGDGRYDIVASVRLGGASEVVVERDGHEADRITEDTDEAVVAAMEEGETEIVAIAIYPNADRVTVAEHCFGCE